MGKLDLTLGQRKLPTKAIGEVQKDSKSGPIAATLLQSESVTTKSLAKDGGLEGILKKIEGTGSIDDPFADAGRNRYITPTRVPQGPASFSWSNSENGTTSQRGTGGGGRRHF